MEVKKQRQLPSLITNSLTRLELTRTNKNSPLLYSLHHFCEATGTTKQKRADRRLNIFKVLEVMLPQIDLDTFTWGQWFTNHKGQTDFYTRGINYIKQQTGMNERTICRALSDLEQKGYIRVQRSHGIGKDGQEIRHYSLRTFTNKLFRELGFKNKTIEETRAWKRKKNQNSHYNKKATKTCLQGIAKINSIFKALAPAPKKKKGIQKIISTVKNNISTFDKKTLLDKASDIATRTGRSPMDVYRDLLNNH